MTPGPLDAAAPATGLAVLREGVTEVSHQSGGLLSVVPVLLADLPHLAADALLGDPKAGQLLGAAMDALRRLDAAPRRSQPLCASCPRMLRPGRYNLALVMPECDDPTRMLALGVCRHCATDAAGVMAKASESLHRIWPDLRPVKPTHASGGRA